MNIVDNRSETALSRAGNDGLDSVSTSRMSCSGYWAVVQTYPQAERWACANIERLGYRTYLPLYAAKVRDRSVRTMFHTALRPLFPGYAFVRFGDTDPWIPVRWAPGIAALLQPIGGGKPHIVPRGAVEALQAGEASRRTLMAPGPVWATGTPCKCLSGPFRDVPAVVIAVRRKSARIALVVLGALREVSVSCDALATRE